MGRRRVILVGPTLLVGIGVILLLNNLGVLAWGLWDVLRLWPVVLIAAGLELLFGDRSIWGSVAAAALLVVVIAGAIWLSGGDAPRPTTLETVEVSYSRESADSATIILGPAVADLSVGPLRDAPQLAEGTIQLLPRETLRRDYERGEPAILRLVSQEQRFLGFTTLGSTPSWDIDLNTGLNLSLDVDMGVGSVGLDLAELQVSDVGVDFGVGQVALALPSTGGSRVVMDGGIGSLLIEVPDEVGVRISSDSGLVTHNVPDSYTRTGNVYTSPSYTRADTRIEVTISLGIGTVTVRDSSE